MAMPFATELLRPGLLQGVRLVIAGASVRGTMATAVEEGCVALGASVYWCALPEGGSPGLEEEIEAGIDRALEELGEVDLLAVDAAGLFAAHGQRGGREALVGCMDATWSFTRAVANRAFIARERGGRIVYVAPPSGGGPSSQPRAQAEATRAALENLARTLSIEWARYGIAPLTIAPGMGSAAAPGEVAALIAYLASPAGAYFSGCLLDLRGAREDAAGSGVVG
jgi:NAD(P)-dependent dehydrogenase (short-subunit alcohol dehydrogenase family)